MSSIRNITASSAVPDDLAKRLGPAGINEILLTLWQGYQDPLFELSSRMIRSLKNNFGFASLYEIEKFVEEYHKEKKSTQADIAKIDAKAYIKVMDKDKTAVTSEELKMLRNKINEILEKQAMHP